MVEGDTSTRFELPRHDACPFCEILAGRREGPFVVRGSSVSSLVNLKQFERGALLVIPNRHVPSLLEARADEIAEVAAETHRLAHALVRAFDPAALNVYQNNGVQAGQTVAHYHVHLVPRYPGSSPSRIFRERDWEPTPLEEREAIAREVRAALATLEAG
jgi:histidine triad (HIT) family protein